MTTINITSVDLSWDVLIYAAFLLLTLYFLIKLKQEFDSDNLVSYLLYLTHKIILFWLFVTFTMCFIMGLTTYSTEEMKVFLKDMFFPTFYYAFINYGVLYSIKFMYYCIEMAKKTDIYAISYFSKIGGKKLK